MKKVIINGLLIISFLILYFLQANLFTWFKIAGIMPNLFILFILFISLYTNRYMGIGYGIVIGLLIDLFIAKKVGISAIMLGAIGVIGTIFDKNFSKENRITLMIMVVISTIIFEVGSYILGYFVYDTYVQILPFILILLIECLYNVLITIIIYPLMQLCGNKMEQEYKGDKILTRYF